MAKVDQVDLGTAQAAQFVKQGIDRQTGIAEAITAFGGMAVDAYKGARVAEASQAGKSLLDKFQGTPELLDISRRMQEAQSEQRELTTRFTNVDEGGINAAEDFLAQEHLKERFQEIEELKANLNKERKAVQQGLMSTPEFREKAETMYYSILAKSPGLKSELAAAMSEFISFDPRGQSALLAIEARKPTTGVSDEQKAQADNIKRLKDAGFWDESLGTTFEETYQANMEKGFNKVMTMNQAKSVEGFMQNVQSQGIILDKNEQIKTLADYQKAYSEQGAGGVVASSVGMVQLPDGTHTNIINMSPNQILEAGDEVKTGWLTTFEKATNDRIAQLRSYKGTTSQAPGSKEFFDAEIETLQKDLELITKVLNSKTLSEVSANMGAVWNNRAEVTKFIEVNKLNASYPDVVTLSAMDALGVTDLMSDAAKSLYTSKILSVVLGKTQYENNTATEDSGTGGELLQKFRMNFEGGKAEISPESFQGAANVLIANMQLDPEDLKLNAQHETLALLGNKKFLEELKATSPAHWERINKKILPTVSGIGEQLKEKIDSQWSDFRSSTKYGLDARTAYVPKNYHLEWSGGKVLLKPNTNLTDVPEGATTDVITSFASRPSSSSIIRNMIQAYMLGNEFVDEETATAYVSGKIGFSPRDVTTTKSPATTPVPVDTDFGTKDFPAEAPEEEETSPPVSEIQDRVKTAASTAKAIQEAETAGVSKEDLEPIKQTLKQEIEALQNLDF